MNTSALETMLNAAIDSGHTPRLWEMHPDTLAMYGQHDGMPLLGLGVYTNRLMRVGEMLLLDERTLPIDEPR